MAAYFGDFFRIPQFDRNPTSVRQIEIKSAPRSGHIERHPMGPRQDGERIRPDLVGRIPVGRNAIGAREDALNSPFPHDLPGHRVANQRGVQTPLHQLPGGQSGPLQKRPCFVHENVQPFPLILRGKENREGRTVLGSGKSPRVAMRKDTGPIGQQFGTVPTDGPASCHVFAVNRARYPQ